MSTRRDILRRIAAPLETLYGAHEARQIALLVVAEHTGLRPSELLADPGCPLEIAGLDELTAQLAAGRPLQYVLGHTEFCGLQIGVREGVLIPRPETEELVDWIAAENPSAQRLLDIGTGSGCIALALKQRLPHAEVRGADISAEALAIARENAAALGLEAAFRQADALKTTGSGPIPSLTEAFPGPFDVIVSNPPYIPQAERAAMRRNVTGYEPGTALFVPDDDPLCFYRAIARAARRMLSAGGRLYFEVHERFGDDVCALLRTEGFGETELRCDFLEKTRMVCCRNVK